jgi:hypothetical protein
MRGTIQMQKTRTTQEIKEIIEKANMDFDSTVNIALNEYLPKIVLSCPFTNEPCLKKQCMDCNISKKPQS